ncbi:Sir2 family NAD-dependent protein deacetylase, partial [Bacillus thuringiensis]|uniref:Sir2 family NAD-dependent protein deacetylase n=1 Tax=Bacillus thuringiensis TaxID=1428 RepID=UPI00283ABF34
SNGGLWDEKKPEDISHFAAVDKPEFVKFFADHKQDNSNSKHTKAHEILAKSEEQGKVKSVITQNIDSEHKDADSKNII